jgi:hypothetical protein
MVEQNRNVAFRLADVQLPHDAEINKARELLHSILPEPVWASFLKHGTIEIAGERGVYVISPNCMTEIRQVGTGTHIGRACLQLSIMAPSYDRMVAEYLILKNAEEFYWKTANIMDVSADIRIVSLAILDLALLIYLLLQLTALG